MYIYILYISFSIYIHVYSYTPDTVCELVPCLQEAGGSM